MRRTSVLIAIQARSTSTRLPNKVMKVVGAKPIVQHVIDTAKKSERYLNDKSASTGIYAKTALLIPTGDPVGEKVKYFVDDIVYGDELDVLSRFKKAVEQYNPDYLVRLTSDCVLLNSNLVSKHIKLALDYELHYCSNVDERYRTYPDGFDVEVISKKAMEWLFENAKLPRHKEHVTLLFRENPPVWAHNKIGHIIGFLDLSGLKLSVDTEEDLTRVRAQFDSLFNKIKASNNDTIRPRIFRF